MIYPFPAWNPSIAKSDSAEVDANLPDLLPTQALACEAAQVLNALGRADVPLEITTGGTSAEPSSSAPLGEFA
jgi:hypothetical protein